MYEISIVHFAGKEVFSHMAFSSNCLANTSRKLGTYLLTTITIGCHRSFHRRARLEAALNEAHNSKSYVADIRGGNRRHNSSVQLNHLLT